MRKLGARSLLVLPVVLALSACRTPQTLCDELTNTINNTGDACGLGSEWELRDPMNPLRRGCGIVSAVSQPDELINDCIPFLNDVADQCGAGGGIGGVDPEYQDYLMDYPDNLPSFCSTGHFETRR